MRKGKKLCIALYIAAGASALLYGAMRLSSVFAEFFNNTVSAVSRRTFAFIADLFPFSIAEAAVLLSPLFLALVIVWCVRRVKRHGILGLRRVIASLLAVLCFFVTSFVLNGAAGYFGKPMAERLALDGENITKADLISCMEHLAEEINGAVSSGTFYIDGTGATVNPYSLGETAHMIEDSYCAFRAVHGFPQSFRSNPKILVTSPYLTYTHMSGIYCDYTGEININTNYPDFVVVSTVAHELSHQRGVAPEDEANFMAYAVLRESPFAYLRYAGALDAFTTVSSYLYKADYDSYRDVRGKLCDTAKDDLAAYSEFFDRYRDSAAAKVTESVNNAYLKSQGTSGTVSYDEATYLIVKYLNSVYSEK